MFPSWYFILFSIVFFSVYVHSHETKDKIHEVTQKLDSGLATVIGSKMPLNGKREGKDSDDSEGLYTDSNDSQDDRKERVEETNDDSDNDENSEDLKKRSLQTGDIFTPAEFLPIASKLYMKVTLREGRGIVSSAKSPEDLADNLFHNYFMTPRRIVKLTEKDLSGLDALTALALEGEAVKMRSSGDSITEEPVVKYIHGQFVDLDQTVMRCHYKLLFKKVSPSDSVLRKGQSGVTPFNKILKLEKKMNPNRHLIINHKGRKSNKENNNFKTRVHVANEEEVEMDKKDGEQKKIIKITHHNVSKEGNKKVKKLKSMQKLKHRQNKSDPARNKKLKKQRKLRQTNSKPKLTEKSKHLRNKHIDPNLPITTTQRPVCTWRYICRIAGELDSCRLHTSCLDGQNNNPMLEENLIDTKTMEQTKEKEQLVLHFRKMMGITVLDEEVEKIIEQHVMLVQPENFRPDAKIETLDEYFDHLIRSQQSSTMPSVAVGSNEDSSFTRHPLAAHVSETTTEHWISSRDDLRQIGDGKVQEPRTSGNKDQNKTKSTPVSNIRNPQNFHVLSSESTMITTQRYNKS